MPKLLHPTGRAIAVFAACAVWLASLGLPQTPRATAEDQPPVNAAYLNALAIAGDFDKLLLQLQAHGDGVAPVESLIEDLERFQKHNADRRATREDDYRRALEDASEKLEAGQVERALRHAIDAHSLSLDPQATLATDLVARVTEAAETRAADAEANEDWLEALGLYRLLDILHESNPQHRKDVERTAAHVRVLQVYAPDRLDALARSQAERRGDDRFRDQLADVDHEPWQQRLRGVELPMLRDALARAARRHVNDRGFATLMRGAVQGLLVLIDTPAVYDGFDRLADAELRDDFRQYLNRVAASLDAPDKKLNFLEAATLIDRVVARNEMTVRLPEAVLVFEMAEGAVGTLDDFSSVIWPHDLEQFSRSTQGKFTGVGIQITRRDGQLVVVTPLEGTPAQQAGIKAGDVIIAVDGVRTASWTLDRAVREITGPEGTDVTLTVERVGNNEPIDLEIQRAEIVIESIRGWQHTDTAKGGWNYLVDEADRIAYVRLSQFIPQTADALDDAIAQVRETGPIRGLVLDLRHNPGGLLSSAIDVADRFLRKGAIVATVDGDGRKNNQTSANRFGTYENFPVAILINRGSASASEIVAGALQDHDRATVIGTRSFGKGSVQDLFRLADGRSYLKLTTQYYQLPDGRIIHRKDDATAWGIDPELEIDMTDQQVADLLEFRQLLDVLREPDEPVMADAAKPWAGEAFRVKNGEVEHADADRDGAAQGSDADDEAPDPAEPDDAKTLVEILPPSASQILELGLDPQLEAALLVLKTRLAADRLAMAR